jgi:mono/diheme cytochrome c family protein
VSEIPHEGIEVNFKREFRLWVILASAALVMLVTILVWQEQAISRRSITYMAPQPVAGALVFREKGCASCHGSNGSGGKAPSLRGQESLSNLSQLITAMWNHAPRMWQAMEEQKLGYPRLTYAETGQLVSYLFFSRYADQSGDVDRGRALFKAQHCVLCHSIKSVGGNRASDLAASHSVENPIAWTQALWNHASKMQLALDHEGLQWPTFKADEMRDLFAYVRQSSGYSGAEFPFPATDPDEGWKVFQAKGCIQCHSLSGTVPSAGPTLGGAHSLPPSFSEFGAVMLNHLPKMRAMMDARGQAVPIFAESEMSDLMGFIYGLHYVEPSGVASVGESVFGWRGCAQCHGEHAEGLRAGPRLRGRGQTYTATRLATDLWRHGDTMYRQSRSSERPWPMLHDGDIGNLLAFLNSPLHAE